MLFRSGVELHMLYISTDASLYKRYEEEAFHLLDFDEYVALIADAIERLPPDCIIHRLTGDGNRKTLVAPLWTADKLRVLTQISMELNNRKSFQGFLYGNI